jgi:signal transduction protein with GAF and PtsI domain
MNSREKVFFESFREVVKAIHSTLDIRQVLQMLATKVSQVMNLKGCAIRLLDPTKRTLELVAAHGLSEKYISKGAVAVDRSIAEAMEGKTVSIYDATRDPRAQYQKEAAEEGICSLISVPFSIKGRVIGVLRLYTSQPRNFSQEEIGFFEALAEMGALAIENARMYEQLRKDYENLMSDILRFVGYRRSI